MTAHVERRSGLRDRLADYAALVRVPNLFTAPPDVLAGAALTTAAGGNVSLAAVVGLALASVLLYAAGTTLNDAFDAPVDAAERPERPIPSGAISRRRAFAVGGGLLVTGVAVARVVAGPSGGGVAAALALAIVLYDGVLKGTAVGFLTMGATRGLNVVLGTTAAGALTQLPSGVFAVPAVVTAYVAGVTYMAAGETSAGGRHAVKVAGAGAAFAALFAVGYLLAVRPRALALAVGIALAAAFLWRVGRALLTSHADPTPETIGPAVGVAVTGLVLLDAALAAVAGVVWALVTAAFLGPALVLAWTFDVS
jgi:4-hydroxybenzoate polyprenyltransferase